MVNKNLWADCINCKVNCCKNEIIASAIYLTKEEDKRKNLKGINKSFPCAYLNKEELCNVYKNRPLDCRLFPFDLMEIDKQIYWIIWKTKCPISKQKKKDLNPYIKRHEEQIMPKLKKYLNPYVLFGSEKFVDSFEFSVIRKLNK